VRKDKNTKRDHEKDQVDESPRKFLKPLICDLGSNQLCCLKGSRVCELRSDLRFQRTML
jgi:hypothetical protein